MKEILTTSKGRFRFIGLGFGQWEVIATFGDLPPARTIVIVDNQITRQPTKLVMKKEVPTTAASALAASGRVNTSLPKRKTGNPKKLFQLGEDMLAVDEIEKAIQCFKLAIKVKPKWSAPYLKLGYAYFNMGDMEKAVIYFNKYLELDPESPESPTIQAIVESLKE